jgi:hypothetical protein
MGLQAHGAFSNLWIHKTYRKVQSRWDYYHHCGHIVTKYYYPYNPKSYFQQFKRNVFAYAVNNWQNFDNSTKNYYNEFAKNRPFLGYNRYISLYVQAYPYNPPSGDFLLCEDNDVLITEDGEEIELE